MNSHKPANELQRIRRRKSVTPIWQHPLGTRMILPARKSRDNNEHARAQNKTVDADEKAAAPVLENSIPYQRNSNRNGDEDLGIGDRTANRLDHDQGDQPNHPVRS